MHIKRFKQDKLEFANLAVARTLAGRSSSSQPRSDRRSTHRRKGTVHITATAYILSTRPSHHATHHENDRADGRCTQARDHAHARGTRSRSSLSRSTIRTVTVQITRTQYTGNCAMSAANCRVALRHTTPLSRSLARCSLALRIRVRSRRPRSRVGRPRRPRHTARSQSRRAHPRGTSSSCSGSSSRIRAC